MTTPKLLLADDSVTVRKVVELTFAEEGIEVTTVADATAAMQKFVDIQPDIVLVDVGLDGTNGYQICEMIKLDEATKHIPVLLLVGSFEPFDQDEATRVGANGFLTKPFASIRDLVAQVWTLLGKNDVTEEDQPVPIPEVKFSETSDIDNLYESSFANTIPIDNLDTFDDMLGDSSMDDEMIESISPAGNVEQHDEVPVQSAVETKEFDWSPESLVIDSGVADEPKFDTQPEISIDETDNNDVSTEPEQSHGEPDVVDEVFPPVSYDTSEDLADVVSQTDEYSESVEMGTDEAAAPITVDESVDVDFAETEDNGEETLPFDANETTEFSSGEGPFPVESDLNEPSPELIALIAQRVVEKLSVDVIREIAQDAVPRIAEKLIREALDSEQ